MALPRTKVKDLLKAKWPKLNLSNKRIYAIADKLDLPDDADDDTITDKLEELNDIFSFSRMAQDDDRLRNLESKDPDKADPPADPKPGDPKPDDKRPESPAPTGTITAEDIAKAVATAIAPLAQELQALKSGNTAQSREKQLKEALKGASKEFIAATEKAFKRMSFKDDKDFEDFLEETREDAEGNAALPTDNDPLTGFSRPAQSVPGNGKKVSADTADFIKRKAEEAKPDAPLSGKAVFATS